MSAIQPGNRALVDRAPLKRTLDLAGLSPRELDGFSVSSFTLFPDTPVGLTQHLGLSPRWLDTHPDGRGQRRGGAAGARRARCRRAMRTSLPASPATPTGSTVSGSLLSSVSRASAMDAVLSLRLSGGPNASFALLIADAYMAEYGATREDFGRIAVAQRTNALAYPNAIMKSPLTLEQYLSARPISEPFALFDCVMPCAGAEGFPRDARGRGAARGLAYARIARTIERHNAFPEDPIQLRGGWAMDIDELYDRPVAGPKTSTCCRPMTTIRSSR
jgi:hypothetical protein